MPPDRPCPGCGGSRRNVTVYGPSAMVAATAMVGAIVIEHNDDRAWWEMWEAAQAHLNGLREAYAKDSTIPSDEMQRIANGFFIACWSLKDWLVRDSTITPLVAWGE